MDFKRKILSAFGAVILMLYFSCGNSLKDTYVVYVYYIGSDKFIKIKLFMSKVQALKKPIPVLAF